MPSLEESRRRLLDAVGPAPQMTFVRPWGNVGDELIWAGTRELLSGHIYREIGVDELPFESGELAVISGGGAWSRNYHEFMPEVLAIAELRFERVVVFPSTFDVAEDRVRAALEQSDAIVFARELESFEQIRGLCRARLAHDLAFFVDLADYRDPGSGTLDAFRTDAERLHAGGGVDISATAESLDDWLREIERHAVVNTDRAHVMIAAARMGKRVNYASSVYFKIDAIAESSLAEFDVTPIEPETTVELPARGAAARAGDARTRLTIAVTGRDETENLAAAVRSAAHVPGAQVLVLDRNSHAGTRRELMKIAEQNPAVELRFADRDSGVAAAARLAAQHADGEFVLVIDERMRIADGAAESLVAALDAQPSALAVTAAVGEHCGGWLARSGSAVRLSPTALDDRAGATGWVPVLGTLFRRSALEDVPLAGGLDADAQAIDWALRVARGGGLLLRRPDAAIELADRPAAPARPQLVERIAAARALPAHAEFHSRHGLLLDEQLARLVPDLVGDDGALDERAAKLLLAAVRANGPEWVVMEWANGGLAPLLGEPESDEQRAARERLEWLEIRNEMLTGIEHGGWWRLRGRVRKLARLEGSPR